MPLDLSDSSLFREQCFIDGEWRGEAARQVNNPATGEHIGSVPDMQVQDTREAIHAAARAQGSWQSLTAAQRGGILKRWYELIDQAKDDLALILTLEQGKPLEEARGEINYGAAYVEWFAEEAKRVYGEIIPSNRSDARILVLRQPVGVVAAITPWNFPAAMVTRKVAPALAAGCTVVLKPASQTPFTALALAVLAEKAGLPAGVLNVVTGSAQVIGAELTQNPLVRKLSFTGSTEVGKLLMGQSASTMKKLSMELGGNAPFIVFADADLDAAVAGLIASKFRNNGQTCVCVNRVLVEQTVATDFADRLAAKVRQLKVGSGTEAGVTQGPLIDDAAVAKVEEHIANALEHGAMLHVGGKRHALGGRFFEPTVISGCRRQMLIAQEETFGPIAALFAFAHEHEAITMANDTDVGLAGYFFTKDLARAWRVAEALEVGMVGVNTGLISTEVAPFGGIKESGMGREGSRHGIEDYTELKYVCMAGLGS